MQKAGGFIEQPFGRPHVLDENGFGQALEPRRFFNRQVSRGVNDDRESSQLGAILDPQQERRMVRGEHVGQAFALVDLPAADADWRAAIRSSTGGGGGPS